MKKPASRAARAAIVGLATGVLLLAPSVVPASAGPRPPRPPHIEPPTCLEIEKCATACVLVGVEDTASNRFCFNVD